jgi:CheY-like chemotaxis protein
MTTPVATGGPAASGSSGAPRAHILFVDDEPSVLEMLSLHLRRAFDVATATSGAMALEQLRAHNDFAVVVSDMRMPKMDGATFLAQARELAPDTSRILLTGQTDLDAAIRAVNEGQLFRFLTKPCRADMLRGAIEAGVAHHRLVTSERVLLEQTLRGSIAMLVDVLALTNPPAFGRANQIKIRVLQLAEQLGVRDSWQLEIAALASQLGAIALPHELCEKIENKVPLTDDEKRIAARAPAMTEQLLANIPRLEAVRAMLALHVKPPRRKPTADPATKLIELGAHLLRVAIDLEELESSSADRSVSPVRQLLARADLYDPEVLEAVELYEVRPTRFTVKSVPAHALRPGMVLAEDVRLASGALLVARGYEVTASFIERISNFPRGAFADDFKIAFPC